ATGAGRSSDARRPRTASNPSGRKSAGTKVGRQENRHTGESAMMIGVPKEIKDNEARVAVTPAGVKALTEHGHTVLVETQAGAQSGFEEPEYQNAGAEIVGE